LYETGLPSIDLTGNRYQTNEGWLINNGAYCLALAGMTVFRDTAQYRSDTIPAAMEAGKTYVVSMTMRNTSFVPWDEQYRLGAVDDSDPFASGRQMLPPGTTVPPGETHTWAFEMLAPTMPSSYVTDWRMVHENVCWFGDSPARQVRVLARLAPADLDYDGDVDQVDFGHLQACLSGRDALHSPECEEADLSDDGTIDQEDLAIFLSCVGGSESPPGC